MVNSLGTGFAGLIKNLNQGSKPTKTKNFSLLLGKANHGAKAPDVNNIEEIAQESARIFDDLDNQSQETERKIQ